MVQIRATEVQLAPGTRLLGGDRALGSQPAQAVATDPEILGGAAGVEPVICALAGRRPEPRSHAVGDKVSQLQQKLIKDGITVAEPSGTHRGSTFHEMELRRLPRLRHGVTLHCRDLLIRSRPGLGVFAHRRGRFSLTPLAYCLRRTEVSPSQRLAAGKRVIVNQAYRSNSHAGNRHSGVAHAGGVHMP